MKGGRKVFLWGWYLSFLVSSSPFVMHFLPGFHGSLLWLPVAASCLPSYWPVLPSVDLIVAVRYRTSNSSPSFEVHDMLST